ncbi:VanW family protein [Cohnella terricola]|uniref:Vancomycin resistance protein n=1 Tax=Cohnella terricola TaxID=1289167 RepID=A0A559J8X6_9BACL|nr:VanW family protein [Cohnella terricola]TVX96301.1 vancomycin resistance protein [Cohnella terricola]
MKPKKRSKTRLILGSYYYKSKRYLEWNLGNAKFAKQVDSAALQYTIFEHKTPLLRRLKDVEMILQYNKIKNLEIAIRKIDNIMIYPGETFSYWKSIGIPSKRKGYVEGMTLFYGGFKPGIGGGLCQLSNLIYWMTLHTPLTVTERHRHSYDVFPDSNRTQPFGSGATCAYNYLDLRIYNPTDQPYQLSIKMDSNFLYGEWKTINESTLSYEVYEKEHKISQEYWGGYIRSNSLYRRTMNRYGELISDEWITENIALMMYQPFLESSNKG